ncbi:MAG: hypothetical protein IJ493_00270 [Clostridia bacterium]|nr:hypothetical protein [Clostridia bacterium]
MLHSKRITALLLLAAMFMTASCGSSDTPSDTTASGGSDTTADTAELTGRDAVQNNLPDNLDFKGDTVTVLTRSDEDFREEFWADEQNGEIINDLIYDRNSYVSETLNCKIEVISQPGNYNDRNTFMNAVRSAVQAGDDTYDVISYYAYAAPVMATEGILMNLYDVENLSLDKPWWHQRFIDAAEVYDKLYLVAGDICLSTVSYRTAMFFNKNKAEEYIDEDLYALVDEGKWTLDKFWSCVKDVYLDLNGDTKEDELDFYGWDANGAFDPYSTGADLKYTQATSDGGYEWVFNTEKNDGIIEDFYTRTHSKGVWFIDEHNEQNFIDGLRIFYARPFSYAEKLRDMSDDYGILPMPKYDEDQEDYYSMVSDHYSQIMVPVTCKDTALVGAFLELMGEYSYKKITPAYYDTTVKGKYLRDDDSARMFDLIVEGAWYDFATINSTVVGDPVFITRNAMQHKETESFAALYASNESALNEKLTGLLETYKNS